MGQGFDSMNADELFDIAVKSVDMPWGMGHNALQNIPEVNLPYYRFLYNVVAQYHMMGIVECGTYLAGASGHMAAANPEAIVVTIDLEYDARANPIFSAFHNMRRIIGDTISPNMPALVTQALKGRTIDLLFLDSEHDGSTPLRELANFRHLFSKPCLVVCDDVVSAYADAEQQHLMQSFWHIMPGEKYELNFLHPAYGDVKLPGFGVSIVNNVAEEMVGE